MFEEKLANAALHKPSRKKTVEAIKKLVSDAPLLLGIGYVSSRIHPTSLSFIKVGLFDTYRHDRSFNLGMSLINMSRALKCANNVDTYMIQHATFFSFCDTKRDKTQDVTVKMIDIDMEHLGIPDQDYSVVISMPSAEF